MIDWSAQSLVWWTVQGGCCGWTGSQEPTCRSSSEQRGTCVRVGRTVGGYVSRSLHCSEIASQRSGGRDKPVFTVLSGLPPECCLRNHGCRSPPAPSPTTPPFVYLPWRQQDGGTKSNRTGGPHYRLWETSSAPMPNTGGESGLGINSSITKPCSKSQFLPFWF